MQSSISGLQKVVLYCDAKSVEQPDILKAKRHIAWKDGAKKRIIFDDLKKSDAQPDCDCDCACADAGKKITLTEARELAIEALEQAEARRQYEREHEAAWFADGVE